MKKSKGSITVFYTVILGALIVAVMVLLVSYSREQQRIERCRMTELASTTLLANYSSHLFETYGLFAYYKGHVDFHEPYLQHEVLATLEDDLYDQGVSLAMKMVPLSVTENVLEQLECVKGLQVKLKELLGKFESFCENDRVKQLLKLEKAVGNEYVAEGLEVMQSFIPPNFQSVEKANWNPEIGDLSLSDDMLEGLSYIENVEEQQLVKEISENISSIQEGGEKVNSNEGLALINSVKDSAITVLSFCSEVFGINRLMFDEFILGTFELDVYDEHSFTFFATDNKKAHIGEIFSLTGNKHEGQVVIGIGLLSLRTASHVIGTYNDPVDMLWVKGSSVVLSFITGLPPTVTEPTLVLAFSIANGAIDVATLYSGKSVKLVKSNGTLKKFEAFDCFYSDHLRILLLLHFKSILLDKASKAIGKSMGDIYNEPVTLKDFITNHRLRNVKDHYEIENGY